MFPDPWTKRGINQETAFIVQRWIFSKILKSKGYICIATDVEDYHRIEDTFSKLYQFQKLHVLPKEKNLKFFLDLKTKYEQKAISKGGTPSYLVYKKV